MRTVTTSNASESLGEVRSSPITQLTPRVVFVFWLLSMTMVPVWISVDAAVTIPFHCAVALIATAICWSHADTLFTKFDAYFVVFLTLSLAAIISSGWTEGKATWAIMIINWGIPFAAARLIISATGTRFAVNAIAIVFAVVGIFSIVELLLSWHPFIGLRTQSSEFEIWSMIQRRGGRDRSEWAFGHSIALGGSLALAIPFVARSSFSFSARAILLTSVYAGILASGSRGAMIAAGLTTAFYLIYSAKRDLVRIASFGFALTLTLLTFSSFSQLFESWLRSGSEGDRWSVEHRSQLYARYWSSIKLFGQFAIDRSGRQGNVSIDSAVISLGLTFGWIVLILAALPLAVSAFRATIGRGSIAEIALVGQIPLLATVALITQYQSLFFLTAAMAVQMTLDCRCAKDPGSGTGSSETTILPHQRLRAVDPKSRL